MLFLRGATRDHLSLRHALGYDDLSGT